MIEEIQNTSTDNNYQDDNIISTLCCIKCKSFSNISYSKYMPEDEYSKICNEFLCIQCSNSFIDNQNLLIYINQQINYIIYNKNKQYKYFINTLNDVKKKNNFNFSKLSILDDQNKKINYIEDTITKLSDELKNIETSIKNDEDKIKEYNEQIFEKFDNKLSKYESNILSLFTNQCKTLFRKYNKNIEHIKNENKELNQKFNQYKEIYVENSLTIDTNNKYIDEMFTELKNSINSEEILQKLEDVELNNDELVEIRELKKVLIKSDKEYRKNKIIINYLKQHIFIFFGVIFFVNIIIVLMINTVLKKYY